MKLQQITLRNRSRINEVYILESAEIKKLTESEITDKINLLKKELFEKKFNKFTTGNEKPHLVKSIKKDIARLLTHKNLRNN